MAAMEEKDLLLVVFSGIALLMGLSAFALVANMV